MIGVTRGGQWNRRRREFGAPSMAGLKSLGALLLLHLVVLSLANSPPKLSRPVNSRYVAILGKTIRLDCPAEGKDAQLTVWKKYGQDLNLAWDRYKVVNKGVLRIRSTEMEDAGNYTCVATNGFGSLPINYTVIVLDNQNKIVQEGYTKFPLLPNENLYVESSAPYFANLDKMRASQNIVKKEGSTVFLKCAANGNPKPEVYWLKNGLRFSMTTKDTLKVQDLREGARYTCIASNRLGQTNFTYSVSVIGEIREPRLTAPHPVNKTASVGNSVSFQCNIESAVPPEVKWLKRVDDITSVVHREQLLAHNNEWFMVLKNAGQLLELPDGSFLNKLVLINVQKSDAGLFACLAINRKGKDARLAYLKINDADGNDGDRFSGNGYSFESRGNSDSSENDSDSGANTNLLLFIGLPTLAVFALIFIIVFFVKRNQHCKNSIPASGKSPRPLAPVPAHEREAYYYSNCHPQQQTVNPLLNSREKLPKTPTPSVDISSSEFSSVSRTHPPHPPVNPHYFHHNNHNMNYGW